jgi:hypothetical protein
MVEETDQLLQKILIKSSNIKYVAIYERSDIYLDIVLTKSKIYHKQMLNDQSLTQLRLL